MLSDAEKKAMKYFYNLRATIDESNMLFDEDIDVKCGKETLKQITTILNLIEKQSKEIEELKDKIKAKIEEVKKLIIGDENSTTDRIVNWFINQLQSLLEGKE